MNRLTKHLATAGLLAGLGFAAFAQPQQPPIPMPMQPGQGPHMMRGEYGRPMMEQRRAQRLGALKQQLQITAAQESAWNTWTQTLRPAANRPQRPNFVEFARMTTPQRIDRMRELRSQRNAEHDRRAEATKAFYAQLNAQQQKTFDEQSFGFMGRGGMGGRHGGGHFREHYGR